MSVYSVTAFIAGMLTLLGLVLVTVYSSGEFMFGVGIGILSAISLVALVWMVLRRL